MITLCKLLRYALFPTNWRFENCKLLKLAGKSFQPVIRNRFCVGVILQYDWLVNVILPRLLCWCIINMHYVKAIIKSDGKMFYESWKNLACCVLEKIWIRWPWCYGPSTSQFIRLKNQNESTWLALLMNLLTNCEILASSCLWYCTPMANLLIFKWLRT